MPPPAPTPLPVAAPATTLDLGGRGYDISSRALVMGILNRTTDSFYDAGAFFEMPKFVDRAARLVFEGADILDVGGVKAGPGPEIGLEEELERVVPAVEALCQRWQLPVSADTWRAEVARQAFEAGAVIGNDISGFADPDYLAVAAKAQAAVVATHIRLAPRVPDPEPVYQDLVAEVSAFLADRAERATTAGIPRERIVLDAGLDLGKTWQQSLVLLRSSDRLAALGYAVLLSASNKTFLGKLLDLSIDERTDASLGAAALGITRGCRIVRVHDVAGTVHVRDSLAAVLSRR